MGLFIIALIILVAALNITATLVLLVVERKADIAVLGAMGARARSIMLVFGQEHHRRLLDAGWTKQRVQEHLWPLLTAETRDRYDRRLDLAGPDNILVVAAGGPGMAETWMFLPHLSNPVSEKVVRAGTNGS